MNGLDTLLGLGDAVRMQAGSGVTLACRETRFEGELEAATPDLDSGFELGAAQQQRNVIHLSRREHRRVGIQCEDILTDESAYRFRVNRVEDDPASDRVKLHVTLEGQG